jgi:hypothetical protein
LGRALIWITHPCVIPPHHAEPGFREVAMNRSSWIAVAALAAATALMYESCPSTGTAPAADPRVLALLGEEGLPECAASEHGAAPAPYLDAVLRRQADSPAPEPCRSQLLGASDESPRVTRPTDPPPDEVSARLPARLDILLAVAWAEL